MNEIMMNGISGVGNNYHNYQKTTFKNNSFMQRKLKTYFLILMKISKYIFLRKTHLKKKYFLKVYKILEEE